MLLTYSCTCRQCNGPAFVLEMKQIDSLIPILMHSLLYRPKVAMFGLFFHLCTRTAKTLVGCAYTQARLSLLITASARLEATEKIGPAHGYIYPLNTENH